MNHEFTNWLSEQTYVAAYVFNYEKRKCQGWRVETSFKYSPYYYWHWVEIIKTS